MTRDEELIAAFVQGAKWWEFCQAGATLWPSDRAAAEKAAAELFKRGELGLSQVAFAERRIKQREEEGR